MKKLLIVLLSFLILAVIAIYIIVPSKVILTGTKIAGCTPNGFDSCLHNLEKWKQWWPDKTLQPGNDSVFVYNGCTYKLSALFTDGGTVQAKSNNHVLDINIRTAYKTRDSIVAEWKTVWKTGYNPLTRVFSYLNADDFKKNMQTVFDSLCSFADLTKNIYGFPIMRTTFTEVILIANRFNSTAYPTTKIIYSVIDKLRQYLFKQGATEKYYPMMNTIEFDSSKYETMVAISIDKIIPANKDFFISRMVPMKDRFLETQVTGGKVSIEKANTAIEKYMTDHSLSAPARPFEILVTDRSKETDTSKWITRIVYPSM